ncbi:unnamed protein product [Chironomus riparius]|uniref:Uncharacterized protein n=1 Tax=Chironomus riparius TaxID=315576 RepID=A0A9N9SAA0_9DIPT|nr:unnamed protein product [Chironomus riparius]
MLFWTKMNLFSTIFILLILTTFTTNIKIACKYDYYNKWMLNVQSNFSAQHKQFIYECMVTDIKIINKHEREVSNVSGIHDQNMTNENVKSFSIGNRVMHFMPNNVEKFFTNLIVLDVYATRLQEIHKKDLEPFPDLKFLSLTNNELKTINFDLFVYNPNLEVLLLTGNRIEIVNDAFEFLSNLQYLSFRNNLCKSGEAKNNRNEVIALIEDIHTNCEIDYEKAFGQCKSVLKMIQNKQNEAETLIFGSPLMNNGLTYLSNSSIYIAFVAIVLNLWI